MMNISRYLSASNRLIFNKLCFLKQKNARKLHNSLRRNIPKVFHASLIAASCIAVPDPEITSAALNYTNLSHEFLVKQASIQVIHSITTLMTQITSALLDSYDEYSITINQLLTLMEARLEAPNSASQIDDLILEVRGSTNECRDKTKGLEMQMSSITSLVDAAGEAAFSVGAEYFAIASNERLNSAQGQLKRKREEIEKLEKDLRMMEVKAVSKTMEVFQKQIDKKNDNEITENEANKNKIDN